MKVLVYGAGVIGSYLAHVVCAAGNDVTVLARGQRKHALEERGLSIRRYLQRTDTVERPKIAGVLDTSIHYDAVFAVMQFQQMAAVLAELTADYRLLRSSGYPILPRGNGGYFEPGLRRTAMEAMVWLMAKTALGEAGRVGPLPSRGVGDGGTGQCVHGTAGAASRAPYAQLGGSALRDALLGYPAPNLGC